MSFFTGGASMPARADKGARLPRIAVLLPRFSRYGGVEQFAYRLAEGLVQRGYHVDFICARQETEAPPGVRVLKTGRFGFFTVLKMLLFAWRAEKMRQAGAYDLSVSLGKTWNQDVLRVGGGPLKNFWTLSLKALPRGIARWIKTLRRCLSPANWLTLFLEKRQYSGTTKIVAVSHLVRQWIVAAHPQLEADAISIIYNRPDTTLFSPPSPEERARARERLRVPDGCTAVGVATTNFELKGMGPLITALHLLPESFHLFVAGGRGAAKYVARARLLGVVDRVHFLGRVRDMPDFYRALDIFALPTYYDACANVVVEALASGLHVISSRVNGASFFLPPENCLEKPADPLELAWALARCIGAPPPAPFVWPSSINSGVDDFITLIEQEVRKKGIFTGEPGQGFPVPR